MQKIIYLAGAVSGLPQEQVASKFATKADQLSGPDIIVFNPVEEVLSAGMQDESWQTIMRDCIGLLVISDELHLMPCWQQSKGATLERDIALRLGMTIVYH